MRHDLQRTNHYCLKVAGSPLTRLEPTERAFPSSRSTRLIISFPAPWHDGRRAQCVELPMFQQRSCVGKRNPHTSQSTNNIKQHQTTPLPSISTVHQLIRLIRCIANCLPAELRRTRCFPALSRSDPWGSPRVDGHMDPTGWHLVNLVDKKHRI